MVADSKQFGYMISRPFAKFKVELNPWEAGYSGCAPEARDAHVSALPFGPHEPDPPHVPLGNHSHMSSAFAWGRGYPKLNEVTDK